MLNISRIRIRNSSIAGLPKTPAPPVPNAMFTIPLSLLPPSGQRPHHPGTNVPFPKARLILWSAGRLWPSRPGDIPGRCPGHLPDRPALRAGPGRADAGVSYLAAHNPGNKGTANMSRIKTRNSSTAGLPIASAPKAIHPMLLSFALLSGRDHRPGFTSRNPSPHLFTIL